jgi:hypothetical protein
MPKHRNASEIWFEGANGWWATLKPGLQFDGCHSIHGNETFSKEAGLADLKQQLDWSEQCDCDECQRGANPTRRE